ncbi:hypothetical protein DPMN_044226 [Dreissena polymorpha]|uniref:Uncharacterized protein n=1 Tax=Dreissena polymorpha TaxID=45954 RepID=A0A9D4HYM4_DREPO|nr:hypothetical protein DPMN_044226 [Dreissena polymorpha]
MCSLIVNVFSPCFSGLCAFQGYTSYGVFQPAKVTAHYHKGTTFMIKFDESVIARDKLLDGK